MLLSVHPVGSLQALGVWCFPVPRLNTGKHPTQRIRASPLAQRRQAFAGRVRNRLHGQEDRLDVFPLPSCNNDLLRANPCIEALRCSLKSCCKQACPHSVPDCLRLQVAVHLKANRQQVQQMHMAACCAVDLCFVRPNSRENRDIPQISCGRKPSGQSARHTWSKKHGNN